MIAFVLPTRNTLNTQNKGYLPARLQTGVADADTRVACRRRHARIYAVQERSTASVHGGCIIMKRVSGTMKWAPAVSDTVENERAGRV